MFNFLYTCAEFVSDNDKIVGIIRLVYNAIKIGVPIILIVVGMFDMGKAITQQKEDEIKKAQSLLVKKAVAAVIVFLMFAIVQLLVGLVSSNDPTTGNNSTIDCIDKILNGSSETDQNEEEKD
jgi:NADH:ubiquinone oxidoreductase subunit 6 (subunit J)